MQTVSQSSVPDDFSSTRISTTPATRPGLRGSRFITVKPVVPRGSTLPARPELQDAEDGGEAEAHPS